MCVWMVNSTSLANMNDLNHLDNVIISICYGSQTSNAIIQGWGVANVVVMLCERNPIEPSTLILNAKWMNHYTTALIFFHIVLHYLTISLKQTLSLTVPFSIAFTSYPRCCLTGGNIPSQLINFLPVCKEATPIIRGPRSWSSRGTSLISKVQEHIYDWDGEEEMEASIKGPQTY